MTVIWREVYSSNVDKVGWDSETEELLVQWTTGKTSAYAGVDQQQMENIAQSWSVGSAIASQIKPFHSHRYR